MRMAETFTTLKGWNMPVATPPHKHAWPAIAHPSVAPDLDGPVWITIDKGFLFVLEQQTHEIQFRCPLDHVLRFSEKSGVLGMEIEGCNVLFFSVLDAQDIKAVLTKSLERIGVQSIQLNKGRP
eukprot:m.63583 g.63583  ORF g.63583 m.63583 type:complete len:124 (+) comp11588_c0_seq2:44-415(+)